METDTEEITIVVVPDEDPVPRELPELPDAEPVEVPAVPEKVPA